MRNFRFRALVYDMLVATVGFNPMHEYITETFAVNIHGRGIFYSASGVLTHHNLLLGFFHSSPIIFGIFIPSVSDLAFFIFIYVCISSHQVE